MIVPGVRLASVVGCTTTLLRSALLTGRALAQTHTPSQAQRILSTSPSMDR